jgi:hypothetical protein
MDLDEILYWQVTIKFIMIYTEIYTSEFLIHGGRVGGWGILHDEDFHSLYASPNILR